MCIPPTKASPHHLPHPWTPLAQDAHEFLNYLLNDVSEILAREQKAAASAPTTPKSILTFGRGKDGRSPSLQELAAASTASEAASAQAQEPRTWLQEIFQGRLVNQTRCLCCETGDVWVGGNSLSLR